MIKIERIKEHNFKPFQIIIDINNLEDAEDLWIRINAGRNWINKNMPTYYRKFANHCKFSSELFSKINEELNNQGWSPEEGLKSDCE